MAGKGTEPERNWRVVRLGEACHILAGFGFPERLQGRTSGGIPFYKVGDISATWKRGEIYLSRANNYVTSSELIELRARPLPADTTVFAKIGAAIALNRRAILSVPSLVDNNVFGLHPATDALDPKYLFHFTCTLRLGDMSRATTVPSLRKSDLEQIPIPLPPLKEQRRIVAEIEKQFTRLDAGVAALRRVQANLKRYRAAVLKAACEGRLVPTEAELARKERRKFESAVETIARTPQPPRPNRWNSRSKDLILGHSALTVGNPNTPLPAGWAWVPLVDIARMESGHTPSRTHPEWWEGKIPWIGIADAREHDGRTILDTQQHTNDDGLANSAARLLPIGTVCISRTASVGYVVVMGRKMATSQDFVNWMPTQAVTSDWLRIVFSADREGLRKFGKGSVHKTIYFPEWLSAHIALPPIAEQKRIVAEAERRLSVIDELETVVTANLARATRLRQSALQRAFTASPA